MRSFVLGDLSPVVNKRYLISLLARITEITMENYKNNNIDWNYMKNIDELCIKLLLYRDLWSSI